MVVLNDLIPSLLTEEFNQFYVNLFFKIYWKRVKVRFFQDTLTYPSDQSIFTGLPVYLVLFSCYSNMAVFFLSANQRLIENVLTDLEVLKVNY